MAYHTTFMSFAEVLEDSYHEHGDVEHKIAMIKDLRAAFGTSLMETKYLVEWYIAYRYANLSIRCLKASQINDICRKVQQLTSGKIVFVDVDTSTPRRSTAEIATGVTKFFVIASKDGSHTSMLSFDTNDEAKAAVKMALHIGWTAKIYQEVF